MTQPRIHITTATNHDRAATNTLMRTIAQADPTNPNLASFRHYLTHGHPAEEAHTEYIAHANGKLAGRCTINRHPTLTDIGGYGKEAATLLTTTQLAVLAGDIVAPDFRGLGVQQAMINHRLKLLMHEGFTYVMCGIIESNHMSFINYERAGFETLSHKTVTWPHNEPSGQTAHVTLLGRSLPLRHTSIPAILTGTIPPPSTLQLQDGQHTPQLADAQPTNTQPTGQPNPINT